MTLILCEKPSVAKSFATALNAKFVDGYFKTNEYIITNCVGHLFELYMPEDYDTSFKSWSFETLPIIPNKFLYKKIKSVESQTKLVLKLLSENKENKIIIATDAGREGELIGRLALQQAGFKSIDNIYRFWESASLTPETITRGLTNLKPLKNYSDLGRQGYTRQHADWLVGINMTRLLSIATNTLMPVGRVQTSVLNEIYNREQEIKNFRPQKYFEYIAELASNEAKIKAKKYILKNNKIITKFENGNMNVKECINKTPILEKKEVHEKKEDAEKLFDLTSLQKKAFKEFGLSPDKVLQTAQKLYEEYKCLSYPRTPSRVMGESDVDLINEKFNIFRQLRPEYSKNIDSNSFSIENKRIFNNDLLEDHHALIPLKEIPESATQIEKSIFDLVVRQFFISLSKPYIFEETKVYLKIKGHTFYTSGNKTIQEGWKYLISTKEHKGKDTEEFEKNNFDNFDFDNSLCTNCLPIAKKTKPKPYYKIDTLLTFMENPKSEDSEFKKLVGLGTPATRAEIITSLFTRKYISEDKKNIRILDKGVFLIKQIKNNPQLHPLIDIAQTTRWEEEMMSDTSFFLENIKKFVKNAVSNVETEKFSNIKSSLGICPICKNNISESKKNYYCSNYKNGCNFSIWKNICGAKINLNDLQNLLTGKETNMKKCKNKNGKEFQAKFKLTNGKVEFIFK